MKARTFLLVAIGSVALPILSIAQHHDGHGEAGHGPSGGHTTTFGGGHASGYAPRGPSFGGHTGGYVERSNHGSLRHENANVYRAPEIRHEEHEGARFGGGHPEYFVHHDNDLDMHRHYYWHDFARGRHYDRLPLGYFSFNIGGLPYFYYGGTYFQPVPGGYEEVYPPVGAVLTQPPPGSYEIIAPGGQVFYYAGGAFYQQQPDGTFVLVGTPIGVIVPELPPGAVQVILNGNVAYQFNGVYYLPVFVNGVTQYQTFVP